RDQVAVTAGIGARALQPKPQITYVKLNGVHDSVGTAHRVGVSCRARVTRLTFTSIVEVDGYEVVGVTVGVCGRFTLLQLLQDQYRRANAILTLPRRISWQILAQRCRGRGSVERVGWWLVIVARETIGEPLCGDSYPLPSSILIF